jgi:hypothetical protein
VSGSEAKRAAVERTQRGARYGSGTLIRRDAGRQVQRGLGFVHSKRHTDGLTRAEAEAALGKLREQVAIKRTEDRAAETRRAAFGPLPVGKITCEDVRSFAAALERKGLAPK